jgi:hypothetical protein
MACCYERPARVRAKKLPVRIAWNGGPLGWVTSKALTGAASPPVPVLRLRART